MFENEGITDSIRQAFVIYLASSQKPIHELLNPTQTSKDLRQAYEAGFVGMTQLPISYEELLNTRLELSKFLLQSLTFDERRFLISVKSGQPDWEAMPIAGIEKLPALEWKAMNIKKMEGHKHKLALDNLRNLLEV